MNTRRLLYWGDLEEARRRAHGRGLARLPAWVASAVASVLLLGAVAYSMGAFAGATGDAADGAAAERIGDASMLWMTALAAGHVLVIFGAPFRLFWRRDAALLARLPIPGKTLFAVGLVRSLRATALVLVPCLVAAAGFLLGPAGTGVDATALVLRHLALAVVAALGAGLLAPAAALAAGGVVASAKAQAVLSSLGGEFQAPPTSWLGILPGFAGAGLALLLIIVAPWAKGSGQTVLPVDPAVFLAVVAVGAIAAGTWAWTRAGAIMLGAAREVAALDHERLAHVDLVEPSPLERFVGERLLGNRDGARLVFAKDTRLARRRYPIPFFTGLLGLLALWIAAAVQPDNLLVWAAVISAGLGTYGAVMARRLVSPPIEHPTFLRTLPVGGAGATRAKRARVLLWTAFYLVPGAIAVVARAGAAAGLVALVLGIIAAAAVILGMAALSASRD